MLFQSIRRRALRTPAISTGTAPSLPLEIHFLVIDEFEGDKGQLRELCHICRAWATYAQSLLLREVYVRYNTQPRLLALLNTSRNIGQHITILIVLESIQPYQSSTRALDGLAQILPNKLPNLRTLDVSYRSFGDETEALLQPPNKWASITCLRLRFCNFATTDIFVAFVATFLHLDRLDIFQCCTRDVGGGRKTTPLRTPILLPAWHLSHLAFGEFPQNALLDWMVADPGPLAVDHLRILSIGPDASAFNALLNKIGAGLKHLELPSLHRHHSLSGGAPEISLSIGECTALQALSFSERSAYDLGRGILSVLSQISSPFVTTVSFHIFLSTGYLDVPWEEVEAVLTTETAFPRLREVVFHMWGGPPAFVATILTPFQEAVLLMEDRMVLLEARGLLQFVDAENERRPPEYLLPPKRLKPTTALTTRKRLSRIGGWISR